MVLAVCISLALVLGGGALVETGGIAVAEQVHPATTGYLNETAVSPYAFVTRGFDLVPRHSLVEVAFFNGDTTGQVHTFTLLNWSNVTIPTSYSTGQIGLLLHAHGTLVNLTEGTEGDTAYGSFESPPSPGYYEFVCMTPGHFTLGMYGYVAFGEPLPSNLSFASGSPGPGLAVFIIVGTIVALTVLAIVLGFVMGRRRGSEHEMPPERLGYAEPGEPGASSPSPPPPPPPTLP